MEVLGPSLLAASVVNVLIVSISWLGLWYLAWSEVRLTDVEISLLSGVLILSALLWWMLLMNRKNKLQRAFPAPVYTYSRFSLITCLAGGFFTLVLDFFLIFYDPDTLALSTALAAILTPAVLFGNPLLVRALVR